VLAGWSWRLVVLGLVIYYGVRVLAMFQLLIVPLLVALLLVALVRPLTELIAGPGRGRSLPRGFAALLTLLITLAVVGGLVGLIGQQVADGFPTLREDTAEGLRELQEQLARSPLHLSTDRLTTLVEQATVNLRDHGSQLVTGALQVTSTAGHLVTGFFLVLFSSYFFLAGGAEIWAWVVRLFPRHARTRVDGAARRAWATLTSFVRATLIVALVDGLGVAVAAYLLHVPLALPLGVLVFLGAFVPIIGSLVSGSVAVLVALVDQGPLTALLMLAAVILVQQIEAHGLQPFLLGRAVSVHPLAVILAIGAGVLLGGIVGALFAVPTVAVVNVVVEYLRETAEGRDPEDEPGPGGEPEEPIPEVDSPVADRPEPTHVSTASR
jgi:predicted PurR-regulated permease PerM